MENPFSIKLKSKPDLLTMKFSGNLVINYIEDITGEVKDKIDMGKPVHVEISNPESIDLTFVQLVISLQKTCMKKDISFTVSAKIKDDQKLLLTNAGFKNIISN